MKKGKGPLYYAHLKIADTRANAEKQRKKCQIDCGSSVNCIDVSTLHGIARDIQLRNSNSVLKMFNNTKIRPTGVATLRIESRQWNRESSLVADFEVVPEAPCILISGSTGEKLGLLTFDEEVVNTVSTADGNLTKNDILTIYKDVFTGLGKLPGTYHIDVDENKPAVQHAPRRVAHPLRSELKAKRKQLEDKGIIRKSGPAHSLDLQHCHSQK